MVRASVVNDGDNAVASQYEALRDKYAVREQSLASYVFWEQDSVYYADHCLGTGNDFSSPPLAGVGALINSCNDALTGGGIIFGKALAGTYPVETQIKLSSGISLIGEGCTYGATNYGTVLLLSNNVNTDMIVNKDASNDWIQIKNITLAGNRANQTAGSGISLTNAPRFRIEDVRFNQWKDYAINVGSGSGEGHINRVDFINIECNVADFGAITINAPDGWVTDCQGVSLKSGIYLASGAQGCIIRGNMTFTCGWHGIYNYSGYYNQILGNRCTTNTQSGIALFNTVSNVCNSNACFNNDQAVSGNDGGIRIWGTSTDNELIGNRCYDKQGIKTQAFGISMAVNSDDNTIIANTVRGNKTVGIVDAGAGNTIRNNPSYVTENSGTGTITNPATAEVIAHGLDVTPTVDDITITLAENPTNAITALWVDTIGAANFTVNCEPAPGASDLDFGWRVVVL